VDFQTLLYNMELTAHRLAEARRNQPQKDDMLSALMAAEIDGERLSFGEFGGFFRLILSAGHETTKSLLSNGLLALITYPNERQRLLADPALIPTAVEEMFRFAPSVYYLRRNPTRDVEICGQKIPAGDKVVLWHVSGNRDEEVFADPDTFDVGRTPNEHLAFGAGPHYCLGAALGRLEARIAFEELLRRLPDIELNGPVTRLRSNIFHGIKSMPIRFTPAR
jgi:cholest-4-en-3-one 26-monooxygenase